MAIETVEDTRTSKNFQCVFCGGGTLEVLAESLTPHDQTFCALLILLYDLDFRAMQLADTFVLLMPCGRSAHIEFGWAVGQKKSTIILLDSASPQEPELMYKMADHIVLNINEMFTVLHLDWSTV